MKFEKVKESRILYFHPERIRITKPGEEIDDYQFFNCEIFEVLHLSHDE